MCSAFGLAGYYFGSKPTSGNSESNIAITSKPWENEGGGAPGQSKYKYHPGGNVKSAPRDAPSVSADCNNFPRIQELHDKYNKWGKDGY
ncbi:hypothetical protein GP486_006610 [Trichoglossum hirsutum]|uniref:Uncharacterized protein n=1 Tax=Trichoglossum hirsutum TaxID=265104 RepID=A0A9P8IIG3_9PEZI|nr:hypothetical protein GP486_006610 [Trichoglossum hirsutum]